MGWDDALALLKGIDELSVAKGKKVVHVNLKKNRPEDDELVKLMLGPTGNLRAPTLRKGKTLVVGFNNELYSEIFG
jgi:arsenate reductase-like glutaredoxin family protein